MHLDSSDSEVECKHKSHRIGIEWEEVQYNNLEEKILPSKYFTQMSLSNNSNLSKMSKKSDVNAEILSQKYDKHIMLSTTLCPQCSG